MIFSRMVYQKLFPNWFLGQFVEKVKPNLRLTDELNGWGYRYISTRSDGKDARKGGE